MRVSGEIVNCIGLGFAFSDTSYKIDTWKQWRCLVQLTCKYNNMAKLSQVSESSCLKLEKIKRSTIKTDKKGAVKQDIPSQLEQNLSLKHIPCHLLWHGFFCIVTNEDWKWFLSKQMHTCQVGKVQKREISLFASCQTGRFSAKPSHDINFVHKHTNFGWNIGNGEIFPPYNG